MEPSQKPCIVNVMLGRGLGGIEQALIDYSEALLLAGYKTHAIIAKGARIEAMLKEKNIPYFVLPNLGAWDPLAKWRLKKLLAKLAPAAAIAHGNRAVGFLRAAATVPVIAITHNYSIKLTGLSAVFCPTVDLIRHTKKQGVAAKSIFHITNVTRVADTPISYERHAPPVIGTMGRFVKKKGFDVLIEALARMHQQGTQFQAVIAGDGEERAALGALVKQRGLESVVTFPGWMTDKEQFLTGLDIFCLPSQHEPFGIVLLEAMAHGLPVITTDSEGPSEIIQHNNNGLVAERGDAEALARGLSALLAEPANAERLGRNAHETVLLRYDLRVMSEKLDLALKKHLNL